MKTITFCAAALLCGVALAQTTDGLARGPLPTSPPGQADGDTPALVAPARPLSANDLMVPIHTLPADPVGGEYGSWAAGPAFKCSFHDGFAFYPYLGPDYPENLPLCWRTVSVKAGEVELLARGAVARHEHRDWRYEYRRAGFVETYDVSEKGVEQSFTIHERPERAGDLVVRGAITTRLHAANLKAAHGKIAFRGANGKELMSYGAAFAVDARGARADVLTSFDGDQIELRLDAGFVATAVFPVTIDPLLSAVVVESWTGGFGLPFSSSIGYQGQFSTNNTWVCYARQFSFTDLDVYARVCQPDFSSSSLVFADITTSWSAGHPRVAGVGGERRWAMAFERAFPASTTSAITAYTHDFGNVNFNTGAVVAIPVPGGFTHRYPVIGGQRIGTLGSLALVVFQSDQTLNQSNTANSEVLGQLIDVGNSTRAPALFGPRVPLDPTPVGTTFDREAPHVNQENAGNSASWIVGWQQLDRTIPNDDWDVVISQIAWNGAIIGTSSIGSPVLPHKVDVRIAGSAGRYLGSWVQSDSAGFGRVIEVQRFDWPDIVAAPTSVQPRRSAATSTVEDLSNGELAYDSVTNSHWAAIYRRGTVFTTADLEVVRVGFTGGVLEQASVYQKATTGAYDASITFDTRLREFKLAYCAAETTPLDPVYAVRFQYPTAQNTLYGTGCGGTILARRPDAGFEFFTVDLDAGLANAGLNAWLLLGTTPSALDLAPVGMPSCFLNVNILAMLGPFTLSSSGSMSLQLPLPDVPVLIGDVYFQWLYLSLGVPWPTKFATSRGLKSEIR